MQITFLGGADEVGASATLITIAGKRMLIDAGIRVSAKVGRTIESDQLPDLNLISQAGGIDYLLVTHAHTDHTGALPLILEQYPHVPVLATQPTIDLIRVLQADAQRIMKTRQDEEGEIPLFDAIAVERLLSAIQAVEFLQTIHLAENLQVTFHPSGHIIGAASLVIESDEGTLVMSGDLSLTPQRAVNRAEIPNVKADLLVLESTYGGKLHANRLAEEKRLIATLKQITDQGGKALIPAFALGRAQEVLQILLHYRDQLDVPIYVDGMVRSVCRAYYGFRHLLPKATIEAAGEDDLFFRGKVRSIATLAQRGEVIHTPGPAVIVTSSGMLTGGPSAFYAKALAGDPLNAILLTGYQDEESPGRAIQKLLKQHVAGEATPFRIGKETVQLRCTLGTYALSAHADEAELVSVAQSLGAETVALVHGDPLARSSLAARLMERQKQVLLPVSGQQYTFAFAPRPWKVGKRAESAQAADTSPTTQRTAEKASPKGKQQASNRLVAEPINRPVDASALWERYRAQASGFSGFYSARELAKAWFHDATRTEELTTALVKDGLYFTVDWQPRLNDTQQARFRVRTPDQVHRARRQQAILHAHPTLAGAVVVLRDINNRVRLGSVAIVTREGFEATVLSATGRQYPADALIWASAPWEYGFAPRGELNNALRSLMQQIRETSPALLAPFQRDQLRKAGQPIDPLTLMPPTLPETVTPFLAQVALVWALAEDGAIWHEQGVIHAPDMPRMNAMEMNQTRQAAMESFPPEARLRKTGMDMPRKRMTLHFDFPANIANQYAEQIETLTETTGWQVTIAPEVNQQAFVPLLLELMPVGGQVIKGPSFVLSKQECRVELRGAGDREILAEEFKRISGFQLIDLAAGASRASPRHKPNLPRPETRKRMEINAAYAMIREALDPYKLYKTSLKGETIMLSFITPEVGNRHQNLIESLAERTGYPLMINPNPNQIEVLQIAIGLIQRAKWTVLKGPGLQVSKAQIQVKLNTAEPPDRESIAAELLDQTGYQLVIET